MKIWISILFILCSQVANAATYYVTQSGGESIGGATAISVATHNAGSYSGDDIIYLCDTISAYINIPSSGTSGHQIVYRGDYAGHPCVINSSQTHGVRIVSKDYVSFVNITINGGTSDGIGSGGSEGIVLDGVNIYGSATGADLAGVASITNSHFHNNSISGCRITASPGCAVSSSTFYSNGTAGNNNNDGLFIGDGSTNATVTDCEAYGQVSDWGAGFDSSGSSSMSVTYTRCRSYDNTGIGFGGSGNADDTLLLHSCLAWDNGYNLFLYESVTATIYDCTFGGATAASVDMSQGSGTRTVTFKNNIVSGTFPYAIKTDPDLCTLDSNYNDFYGGTTALGSYNGTNQTFAQWKTSTSGDANSINQDPKFYNTGLHDFRVHSTSPCIDAGTDLGATYKLDYYGHWQGDNGASWDIGAVIRYQQEPMFQ